MPFSATRAATALTVSGFAVDDTAMIEPGAMVSSKPFLPNTTSLTSSS